MSVPSRSDLNSEKAGLYQPHIPGLPPTVALPTIVAQDSGGVEHPAVKPASFYLLLFGEAVVGIVMVVFAISLPSLPHREVLQEVLRLLGHGFFVAALLGLTVDKYSKHHMLRQVTRDVYKYLVGYALPDEVKLRIDDVLKIAVI